MQFKIFASVFFLLLLTGCVGLSYQPLPDDLGQVIHSEGVPQVIRHAQPYILARQSRLFSGDVIITDDHTTATLKLADDSQLEIAPNSRLLIRGVSTNGTSFQSEFSLNAGSMGISGSRSSSKTQATISAATADITLQQGDLWLNHRLNGSLLDVVLIGSGTAIVANSHGTVTLTAPLTITTVPSGAAPRPVSRWSEQKFNAIRDRRMNPLVETKR